MLLHAYGTVYPLRRGDSKHKRCGAPCYSYLLSQHTAVERARVAAILRKGI